MTLAAFLAATDLDHSQQLRNEVDGLENDPVVTGRIITAWRDGQAVANLLMHPDLIPVPFRHQALLRGLASGGDSYLRLAAAVGVGRLTDEDLAEPRRAALVEALLNLTAGATGPASLRAASELGRLMQAEEAPELVVLLRHPEQAVRHNVVVALARLLGTASIADLLADQDCVTDSDARVAVDVLAADGINMRCAASDLRILPTLPHLPDRSDWWTK